MSLQVWLPLNGNIENQGLSGVTFTNEGTISVDTSGKIGSCYSRATKQTSGRIISNSKVLFDKSLSICCWAYVSDCAGDTANGLVTIHSHGHNSNVGITVKQYSPTDYRISCNTGTGNDRTYCTYYGSTNIKNTWSHLSLTYDKASKVLKLYVNGNCEYTLNNYTNYTISDNIILFDWSTTYNDPAYRPACKLNDVRIYDHCLSAKEVKEISRGLVCHWKLSNPYEVGQGNKYNGAVAEGRMVYKSPSFMMTPLENERGYNYKLTYTGSGNNSWHNMNAGHYPFVAGKRYYYSCKIRCHSANFLMDLRASRSDNDWVTNVETVISSSLADGRWHEYVVSQVINSTYDREGSTVTCNPILEFYTESLSTAGKVYSADFDIKDVQVIESDCYVPFIDNSMSTVEVKDCSGLGNNGTKVGNITYKNSSIRYDGCYSFTGDDYIKIPKPITTSNSSYFTVSMWVKPESGCGGYATVLSNFSSPASGFWMAINTEGSGTWFYNGTYAKGNSLLPIGQWSHIAMVFNAGAITWYTDGVATSTSNVSSNTTAFTDYIAIGNSYAGTTWNTDFVGNISDVRIYSSVLSAEDIKELYNTSASIDKNGNMYAYEFKEE